MDRTAARGLTLIEVLVAVAIMAILLGLAAPSFIESIARSRLDGSVSTLANDLQYTRSEAIRRGAPASLTVAAGGASYTIAYTPAGGAEVTLKTVPLPDDVTLAVPAPIVFEPLRGTTTAQNITGSSARLSGQLRITTNGLGRLAVCSPSGALHGHPAC